MNELTKIAEALQIGDDKVVYENTKMAIEQGVPAKTILDDGLIAGMNVISEKFRKHEIFLPHVLLAAKAMYAGMAFLKPYFGTIADLNPKVCDSISLFSNWLTDLTSPAKPTSPINIIF